MRESSTGQLDSEIARMPTDSRYVTGREFFLEFADKEQVKLMLRIESAPGLSFELSLKYYSAHGNLIKNANSLRDGKDYRVKTRNTAVAKIANLDTSMQSTILIDPEQLAGVAYYVLKIQSEQFFSLKLDRTNSSTLSPGKFQPSKQSFLLGFKNLPRTIVSKFGKRRFSIPTLANIKASFSTLSEKVVPVRSVCARIVGPEEPLLSIVNTEKSGRLRFRTTQGLTGLIASYNIFGRDCLLKEPSLTANTSYSSSDKANFFFIPRARKLNNPECMMKSIDEASACLLFQVGFKTLSASGNFLDFMPMQFLYKKEAEQKLVSLFDDLMVDVVDTG